MNSGEWLAGRGKRRAEAVRRACGMLGLYDRGTGHVDSLYRQAYGDGLRDAYAFMAQLTQDWLDDAHGEHDVDLAVQTRKAEEERRREEALEQHIQQCEY